MRDHEANCSTFDDYQSWLRRTSPPGSPFHKCCYDQKRIYNKENNTSLLCCCYICPGVKSSSILATLGVCCLLLCYTFVGAITYMALEGDLYQDTAVAASKSNPQSDTNQIGKIRNDTVNRLWSITEDLNILYRENWTKLAAEEVIEFQKKLFQELSGESEGGSREQFNSMNYHHGHKWSFSSSFLYSLTLITTIGYGSVSPRTTWGKLFTIIYALVGIPLMLLYLSTTGDLLARSFRRLYGKLWWKTKKSEQQQPNQKCRCSQTVKVPVLLCLGMILAYICSGAVLFHRLENWSLLEGSYFCFTSLGTIGFGDLLPGQKTEEISLCACSAYILTGMALLAMCFSLIQEQVSSLLRFVICGSCSKRVPKPKDPESVAVLQAP